MGVPIVICDDSSFARKQLARALPPGWDVEISFAANGVEGVQAIREGKGDILFLDLTMPELDGFGVLEAIRREDLPTMVIVVSGDVQADARDRVLALGALDFVKKPVNAETLCGVLDRYGVLEELTASADPPPGSEPAADPEWRGAPVDINDWCREIANVAMGQTAELLAQLLNVFIELQVPKVDLMAPSELQMALDGVGETDDYFIIGQGFIGAGIAGETLLIVRDTDFAHLAEMMEVDEVLTPTTKRELLIEISNILIGAFLKGVAEQWDIRLSIGHPVVQHGERGDRQPVSVGSGASGDILAIELSYTFEGRDIHCDQLVLFTADSLDPLQRLASLAIG